jgi:hypothetical protein
MSNTYIYGRKNERLSSFLVYGCLYSRFWGLDKYFEKCENVCKIAPVLQ